MHIYNTYGKDLSLKNTRYQEFQVNLRFRKLFCSLVKQHLIILETLLNQWNSEICFIFPIRCSFEVFVIFIMYNFKRSGNYLCIFFKSYDDGSRKLSQVFICNFNFTVTLFDKYYVGFFLLLQLFFLNKLAKINVKL